MLAATDLKYLLQCLQALARDPWRPDLGLE